MVGKVVPVNVLTEQPEWMKNLPGDSYLNARDIRKIFNITNVSSGIDNCIKSGKIPTPSNPVTHRQGFGRHRFSKSTPNQWSVADLRIWFKQEKERINN